MGASELDFENETSTFEYEETGPNGIKRFGPRDTNINCLWYHQYPVSGIFSPLVVTRTRIDGCVQISSRPIKVGIGKECLCRLGL